MIERKADAGTGERNADKGRTHAEGDQGTLGLAAGKDAGWTRVKLCRHQTTLMQEGTVPSRGTLRAASGALEQVGGLPCHRSSPTSTHHCRKAAPARLADRARPGASVTLGS